MVFCISFFSTSVLPNVPVQGSLEKKDQKEIMGYAVHVNPWKKCILDCFICIPPCFKSSYYMNQEMIFHDEIQIE